MREEVKRWWEYSRADLRAAKKNLKIKEYKVASFLAQQAVEKALKAVYLGKYKKILKIHDLVILGRKIDLPKNLLKLCENLSKVYIEARYPVIMYIKYTSKETKKDIQTAEKILKWLKKNL